MSFSGGGRKLRGVELKKINSENYVSVGADVWRYLSIRLGGRVWAKLLQILLS